MVTLAPVVDDEDDDFVDQQPDQSDEDFMSDDDDDEFLHQQPEQAEEEEDSSMSDDDDDHCSDDEDDDDDDFWSDDDDDDGYWSAQSDNEEQDQSMEVEAEHPFPVNAPPASASEAAIAALETAEAPADDCCPVCLQDGGGELAPTTEPVAARPWSRVAPCGHRFHAACVDKWLKVKLTCPVCRCPAAVSAAPAAAARPTIPGIVDEFLAVGFEESYVFDKTQRWNEFAEYPYGHVTAWNSTWEVS